MAKTLSELQVLRYDVYISNVDAGYCDEPSCEFKINGKPITVGQLGEQVLGRRILGIEAAGQVKLRQITLGNLARCFPWFDGTPGTDSIEIAPADIGGDLYDYAVPVRFHPVDAGADTTSDINLLKVAPVGPLARIGKGTDEDAIVFNFEAFPLRYYLPRIVLGYIGAVPAEYAYPY